MELEKLLTGIEGEAVVMGNLGHFSAHEYFMRFRSPHHRVLFGHSDYLPFVYRPYSIGDYDFHAVKKILFIRGGEGAKRMIQPHYTGEEELLPAVFSHLINSISHEGQVEVVVTPELPREAKRFFDGEPNRSRTGHGLQALWSRTRPKLWVHYQGNSLGSFHYQNTQFLCLPRLNTITI